MWPYVRRLLLVGVLLLIPVVPVAILGLGWESQARAWLDRSARPGAVAAAVVGLLAADIFLPVPSSAVSTAAGAMLGRFAGTAACWLGMTLGAAAGFLLARRWGRPLALRWSSRDDVEALEQISNRWGAFLLVVTRPAPLLAEACVLLMGTTRLPWSTFLLAVGASNLGISLAYAALGDAAQQAGWLPWAVAGSLALPIFALMATRQFLLDRHETRSRAAEDPAAAPDVPPS